MSKLSKLKHNPQLFFRDLLRNRIRDIKVSGKYILNKKNKLFYNENIY